MEIKVSIDSKFLDEAEKEIYEILLNQHLSYSDRWYSSPFVTRVMPLLRTLGICGSLFGIVLSVFVIWNKPVWCPLWVNIGYFALAFVLLLVVFYFLPSIQSSIQKWNRNYAFKNCKKIAGKCVKEARKQAPYLAVYEFKGNTIFYYRVKDNISKLAWTRKLKGVAFHGKRATVFFRKWTSFIPKIVILHEDANPVEAVLNSLPVETKPIIRATR